MASNSISPPSTHIHKLPPLTTLKRPSYPHFPKLSSSSSQSSSQSSSSYRCSAQSNNSWRWDTALRHILKHAADRFDSIFSDKTDDVARVGIDEGWDWDRWVRHFGEVDQEERLVSLLKLQINNAVCEEEYSDAAKLKVALAAAAANDSVGRVISYLNRAIEEERYEDAALIRDDAGAGLVGWWASISKDADDPYGRIIRITAEHGRYLATSFSPWQLATDASGAPLFEIFLTVDKNGEYKQQAVYLKRGASNDSLADSSKLPTASSNFNQLELAEEKSDLIGSPGEDADDDDAADDDHNDDPDLAEAQPGFQNILSDMIPGMKVNALKVTGPGKVDRNMISNVIDQILEEENEDKDFDFNSVKSEDENMDDTDLEKDEVDDDAGNGIFGSDKPKEIAVKVVIGGSPQKYASSISTRDLTRVPAKLEKKGRMSFSFSIEKEVKQQVSGSNDKTVDKKVKRQSRPPIDSVVFDIQKIIGREKIPAKVLQDIGNLINLKISKAKRREPLSGSTTFNRIAIPASSDPLTGLYIGARGLYTSEVIQMRRRYGQWHEDGGKKSSSNLEFYEYVEALKITGDPYVPAGQVAFRAKIGKRYQLPHKGILPEEFGVIARYKGQGRLAEPGFQNPRWVDGELVILDGKYIKGGPVVGFVYWAPEHHFLVFFNQLRLQI